MCIGPVLQETHGNDPTGAGEYQFDANHAGQQLEASDNAHVHQVIKSPRTVDPVKF